MKRKNSIKDLKLNNKKKIISVIVPIYNVEKYLRKCIDSILNQTYKNLEIILVDDGSPDNCGIICDEYAKKDDRIKVIHKKNGGLSDARNAGIDVATGEYIGFVDSDDYIAPDMYEYLLNILIESEADISICNFKYVYEKEDSQNNLNKKSNIEVLEKIDALRKNISDEIKSYAWNKLYKINLFKDIRYPVGRKMEDCGTTYKLFDLSNKITIGNEIKYYYLQRENSILNRRNFELYKDYYELTLERYRHIKKKYPYMIENDIDMVNRILNIYIKDSKDMKLYIKNHNTEIISIFNEITNNKNFKKSIKNKMKMKIILFKINKKLFIVMSKIKINRKGKK